MSGRAAKSSGDMVRSRQRTGNQAVQRRALADQLAQVAGGEIARLAWGEGLVPLSMPGSLPLNGLGTQRGSLPPDGLAVFHGQIGVGLSENVRLLPQKTGCCLLAAHRKALPGVGLTVQSLGERRRQQRLRQPVQTLSVRGLAAKP